MWTPHTLLGLSLWPSVHKREESHPWGPSLRMLVECCPRSVDSACGLPCRQEEEPWGKHTTDTECSREASLPGGRGQGPEAQVPSFPGLGLAVCCPVAPWCQETSSQAAMFLVHHHQLLFWRGCPLSSSHGAVLRTRPPGCPPVELLTDRELLKVAQLLAGWGDPACGQKAGI